MANRSLAPLSDWPAGPHPSCNGRFVVPRHSVCTRLHASGSLDNPVTILQPSLSNSPSYLAHHQAPAPLAAAALVSRIISKYNHRPRTSLLRAKRVRVRTYARVYTRCVQRGREHSHSRMRCPSCSPWAIFSHLRATFRAPPLIYYADRQA